jgi:uncharacterized protein (DUF4415 family)
MLPDRHATAPRYPNPPTAVPASTADPPPVTDTENPSPDTPAPDDARARSEHQWNGRHLAELTDEELEQALSQTRATALGEPPLLPPPPDPLSPQEFTRLAVSWPQPKTHVTLNLDEDIVAWFRAHGPRYQQRINAVLRAFVDARAAKPNKRSRGSRDG